MLGGAGKKQGCRMRQSALTKHHKPPQSRLERIRDRLMSACVVEITAASQSGVSSWRTEPYRVLLRVLAKSVPAG
jgi:hypothetical protein